MKITLTLHQEFPGGAPAASKEFVRLDPALALERAQNHLSEALERIAKDIKRGEKCSVGVGIRIIG